MFRHLSHPNPKAFTALGSRSRREGGEAVGMRHGRGKRKVEEGVDSGFRSRGRHKGVVLWRKDLDREKLL